MRNIFGYLQMIWLMSAPPALFSRLFELPWYRRMLEQWLAPVQTVDATVLEVGCAAGEFSRMLAERNMRVSAVDRSEKMPSKAKLAAGTVHFEQADASRLPYPDQHFDIVMAASLLNVVDSPRSVLAEMRRVCREGGTVSVLVPDKLFSDADARLAAKELIGFSRAAFLAWHRMAKKMDINDLFKYFEDCGLQMTTSKSLLGGMAVAVYGQPSISAYNTTGETILE